MKRKPGLELNNKEKITRTSDQTSPNKRNVEIAKTKTRTGGYYFKKRLPEELFYSIFSYRIKDWPTLCQVSHQFKNYVNKYLEQILKSNYNPNNFFNTFNQDIIPYSAERAPNIFTPLLLFSIRNLDNLLCKNYMQFALFFINWDIDLWTELNKFKIKKIKNISQPFILMKFIEHYFLYHTNKKNKKLLSDLISLKPKLEHLNRIKLNKEFSLERWAGCDIELSKMINLWRANQFEFQEEKGVFQFVIGKNTNVNDSTKFNKIQNNTTLNIVFKYYNEHISISVEFNENDDDSIFKIAKFTERYILSAPLFHEESKEIKDIIVKFIKFLALHHTRNGIPNIISNLILATYYKYENCSDSDTPLMILAKLAKHGLINSTQAQLLKDWSINDCKHLDQILGWCKHPFELLGQLMIRNLCEINANDALILKDLIIQLFQKNEDYFNLNYNGYAGFDKPCVRIVFHELLKKNLITITTEEASLIKMRLLSADNPSNKASNFIEFIWMLIDTKTTIFNKDELTLLKNHVFKSFFHQERHSIPFQKRLLEFLYPLIKDKSIKLNQTEKESLKDYIKNYKDLKSQS